MKRLATGLFAFFSAPALARASEAELVLPPLDSVQFLGTDGWHLLLGMGVGICALGTWFGMRQFVALRNLPVHRAMRDISELIYETCKTYLQTQIRFIGILGAFIGAIMIAYFKFFALDHAHEHLSWFKVLVILLFSL